MARRALKRHVQQELGHYGKAVDKNGQFRGARKGEKREGVGRPKQGVRASERHQVRQVFRASEPVHVILRAHAVVGSLRKGAVLHAIREALITVARLDAFHIVHFSVQRTHIHLICEAEGRHALSRGMQTFGISAAKHIAATDAHYESCQDVRSHASDDLAQHGGQRAASPGPCGTSAGPARPDRCRPDRPRRGTRRARRGAACS